MKNNHTHLKRLAAISLVLMLCLSALPMLAPSASAADARDIIYGQPNNVPMIRSPSPLHDELLDLTYDRLGDRFDLTADGTIYSADPANERRLRSSDDGQTWVAIHTFDNNIRGIYVSNNLWGEYLWVSTEGGKVYRSSDGATFDLALQMKSESYAIGYWSFASDDSAMLIGEYGGKNTPAAVYMSTDGDTWRTVFNTSDYRPEYGAHAHLVTIDPYNGWFYIGFGDTHMVSGMHVSKDRGATWETIQFGVVDGAAGDISYPLKVGVLGATYPDEDRVLFYTDKTPEVWEYIKCTGEVRMLLQMPDPYLDEEVKTYSAITGAHGVSYFATREYGNSGLAQVWMTIDGSSYYMIDEMSNVNNLRIHDGRVYGSKLQFNDLTKEQAAMLINDDRLTFDLMYGSTRHAYLDTPIKEVTVTVTGATISNILANPSFEIVRSAWSREYDGLIEYVDEFARHGDKSLKIMIPENKSMGYISQIGLNAPLTGIPLVIKFSILADGPMDKANDPRMYLIYRDDDGESITKTVWMGATAEGGISYYQDRWMDHTIYWTNPPESGTLTGMQLTFYDKGVNYYVDSFSISKYPIFVENDTPSGYVSFMLGDQLIEVGELAEGESTTISLPPDMWLDGLVPIVPLSGLAYTVSIDGTPVSEGEQSIRETKRLLEQTIPLIIGLAVIGSLITMLGRLKF